MGKLLRVLVIIFLAISIGALVLGCFLFMKRELLKGRTQKLETAIVQLGLTIEKEEAVLELKPEYPAKDISPCGPEILDDPERSTFWNDYKVSLEILDQPTFTLNDRDKQLQLMTYYKISPITQRVARDDVMGNKITTGPGTMQDLLDELINKAGSQYDLLNSTREQLTLIRMELVNTITELNQKKREHRESLKKIVELEAEIVRLKENIAMLEEHITELEGQIQDLQDKIQDLERDVALKDEQIDELAANIEELNKTIEILTSKTDKDSPVITLEEEIEAGVKGTVVAANTEWNFVVMELNDAFIQKLLGTEEDRELPQIELFLKRGDNEEFVTKVKLRQLRRADNLGVADVMLDWLQLQPQEGDTVFY